MPLCALKGRRQQPLRPPTSQQADKASMEGSLSGDTGQPAALGILSPNLISPGDWLAVLGEDDLAPLPQGPSSPFSPMG